MLHLKWYSYCIRVFSIYIFSTEVFTAFPDRLDLYNSVEANRRWGFWKSRLKPNMPHPEICISVIRAAVIKGSNVFPSQNLLWAIYSYILASTTVDKSNFVHYYPQPQLFSSKLLNKGDGKIYLHDFSVFQGTSSHLITPTSLLAIDLFSKQECLQIILPWKTATRPGERLCKGDQLLFTNTKQNCGDLICSSSIWNVQIN